MLGLLIKLSGGILIVFSTVMISMQKCDKLKSKVVFIDGLIAGFVSLEEYICGMLIPVEEALCMAANDAGCAADVFLSAANEYGEMKTKFSAALSGCDDVDAETVTCFVNSICSSDANERRTAFSLIRARLAKKREIAEADSLRLCRLYGVAGVLGGFGIVILLF